MVMDYSGSYIAQNCRKNRKKFLQPRDLFSASRLLWKTIGAMLFVTLAIGISSTIWYGIQVQTSLAQLNSEMSANSQLADENRLLSAQQNLMLTHGQMEKTARRLGLAVPAENQIRHP